MIASANATGVMSARSGLLREIAFIGTPIQKYIASVHTATLTIDVFPIAGISPALLIMNAAKTAYRTMEVALAIRNFAGKILCCPPHAYLPIGAPRISAIWNAVRLARMIHARMAAKSVMA